MDGSKDARDSSLRLPGDIRVVAPVKAVGSTPAAAAAACVLAGDG